MHYICESLFVGVYSSVLYMLVPISDIYICCIIVVGFIKTLFSWVFICITVYMDIRVNRYKYRIRGIPIGIDSRIHSRGGVILVIRRHLGELTKKYDCNVFPYRYVIAFIV